jgi:hypothetical protein
MRGEPHRIERIEIVKNECIEIPAQSQSEIDLEVQGYIQWQRKQREQAAIESLANVIGASPIDL